MISTPRELSLHTVSRPAEGARTVRAAGWTRALARSTRGISQSRATEACQGVATVIPQAPASSCRRHSRRFMVVLPCGASSTPALRHQAAMVGRVCAIAQPDRKSTRLNSSHVATSYAVFCLKKQKHILDRLYLLTCNQHF